MKPELFNGFPTYIFANTEDAVKYVSHLINNGYSFGTHCTTSSIFVCPKLGADDPTIAGVPASNFKIEIA